MIVWVKNIGVFIHKNGCGMWDISNIRKQNKENVSASPKPDDPGPVVEQEHSTKP